LLALFHQKNELASFCCGSHLKVNVKQDKVVGKVKNSELLLAEATKLRAGSQLVHLRWSRAAPHLNHE
jgi:hypothetical protein